MTKTTRARYTLEFKHEAVRLHGRRLKTRREAKDEIIDWLLWYNRARLYSTLAYVQPSAVRAGLACQSTKASQLMSSAMGYGFQGQGQCG